MTPPHAHAAAVLPSRNEPETIAAVTAAVDAALDDPKAVIVHADSSDTPDTTAAFNATPTRARKVSLSGLARGKGAQIFCALDWLGEITGPVLIADTDTRNPDPAVYRALLEHADDGCAIADYPRYWDEANLTNHLARPLIDAAFGIDVPQPLAGDIALSAGTVTVLPTAHRALAQPEAKAVDGYGIDVFLLLAAARTGTVTPVPIETPKRHAASFPHLASIYDQAVPVLLALTATQPVPPPVRGPDPGYRPAHRRLPAPRLAQMLAVLNDLAPHEPGYDANPWPLPLVDAWHAVRNGTTPTEAARTLWPHYVHRVRLWLTVQPGPEGLAAAHTRLSAALTAPARSLTP